MTTKEWWKWVNSLIRGFHQESRQKSEQAPTCGICQGLIKPGQLVARPSTGGLVHAGFHGDGEFCETAAVAAGFWTGTKVDPIDWSKYTRQM